MTQWRRDGRGAEGLRGQDETGLLICRPETYSIRRAKFCAPQCGQSQSARGTAGLALKLGGASSECSTTTARPSTINRSPEADPSHAFHREKAQHMGLVGATKAALRWKKKKRKEKEHTCGEASFSCFSGISLDGNGMPQRRRMAVVVAVGRESAPNRRTKCSASRMSTKSAKPKPRDSPVSYPK